MTSNDTILRIAQPYAEALLELANMEDQVSSITEELLEVSELLSCSKPLQSFLANPIINKDSKKAVLNQLLKTQINNVIIKFLYVLIDKHRITLFDQILSSYLKLSYQVKSTTLVYLMTAKALTASQYDALKTKIQEMTKAEIIKIETQINPNLIAGFTLQIGSRVIDTSLFGQLQNMASCLNTTNVLA